MPGRTIQVCPATAALRARQGISPAGAFVDKQSPLYSDLIAVDAIPPLPATAAKLLAMTADSDVEIDDLVAVIEPDPPLNARLIGIANSAFYGSRAPVMGLREAIIRVLGLNMVRNIALGMALTGGFSAAACPRFHVHGYWACALGTADLCSGLARAAALPGVPDPDTAYLVGLLHNLGELLLVHLRPGEMDEVYRRAAAEPEQPLEQIEMELIGLDHWAAGAFLARHWELPTIVGDTIAHLGDPDPGNQPPLVGLVVAARHWLQAVMAGVFETLHVEGVDPTYCEYRSSAFLERLDELKGLARSIG